MTRTGGTSFNGPRIAEINAIVPEPIVAGDPELVRQQLNDGILDLASTLPLWSDLLALSNIDLPVVEDDLDQIFGLGGVLTQLASSELTTADNPVGTFEALRDQINSLAGFSVTCIAGDANCSSGESIFVEFSTTIAGLTGSAEFDDSTNAILAELAAAADLDGSLDYTADLTVQLGMGVDQDGFFLLDDSSITLDFSAGGSVSADYNLAGLLEVQLDNTSEASADIDLILGGSGAGQRIRVDAFADPGSFLSPTASGTAIVSLDQRLQPLDLGWGGDWTMTIDNATTSTDVSINFPTQNELIDAVQQTIGASLDQVLGGDLSSLFGRTPIPLAGGLLADPATTSLPWIDILNTLNGVTVTSVLDDLEITDLLSGISTSTANLVQFSITPDPDSFTPILADFDFSSLGVGGIDDLNASGDLNAELTPLVSLSVGFDAEGFFLTDGSSVGGRIVGEASAQGELGPFAASLSGTVGLDATISLQGIDGNGDGKLRVDEFLSTDIFAALAIDISDVEATLGIELSSELLDYIEVDDDATNNSARGGDVFTLAATTSFDVIIPDGSGGFDFKWNGIDILNSDVDGDFTSTVLVDNVRELARDVIRGNRTNLSTQLLAAFGLESLPLVDSLDPNGSLADGLSIAAGLADAILDATSVLYTVPFSDGTIDDGLNNSIEDWLNNGLPTDTQELIRLQLDLGQLGLNVADNLSFDISSFLPGATTAQAGIENA
ncbi:MAG: hypothetical protein GXP35_16640, partial [Actinobacteria bacterium]|nr:hypothetical protein [Actinomycetota bacterium]